MIMNPDSLIETEAYAEPAVAEVHLHTEEDVLNQVSENK